MAITQTDLHHNFRADLGTTIVSNGLDQWAGQNGEATVTAAVAGDRPVMDGTNTLNGVDCPYFTGSSFLQDSGFTSGSTGATSLFTRFFVLKAPHGQTNAYLVDAGTSTENRNALYFNGTEIIGNCGGDTTSATIPNDEWFTLIVCFRYDQASNFDGIEIYVDGVRGNGTNVADLSNHDGVTIGRNSEVDATPGEFTLAQFGAYLEDDENVFDVSTLHSELQAEWSLSSATDITVSDSVGLSDSLSTLANTFTEADSLSLSDSINEILNDFTVSDSISVADTNDFDISFIIADDFTITDSLNSLLNALSLNDNIGVSDSISVSQGLTNISVSDSMSISDSLQSLEVVVSLQDAVSLLDSVADTSVNITLVDTVSFVESIASASATLTVTDAITIVESVTKTTIGDATKMVITASELYKIVLEVNNLYNITLTAQEKIDGMSKVVGEVIPLKATFTNDSDVATTPGEPVEVSVKQPDGTLDVDSVTVSEGATGVYEYNYTTSQSGTHNYKFVSSDGGIEQGTFFVNKDNVG